jgi:hypothetical protein
VLSTWQRSDALAAHVAIALALNLCRFCTNCPTVELELERVERRAQDVGQARRRLLGDSRILSTPLGDRVERVVEEVRIEVRAERLEPEVLEILLELDISAQPPATDEEQHPAIDRRYERAGESVAGSTGNATSRTALGCGSGLRSHFDSTLTCSLLNFSR